MKTWLVVAQKELAQIVREIEAELGETYETTLEEFDGIDRGLKAAPDGHSQPRGKICSAPFYMM